MRVLTYNVHSGVGTDGRRDLERIAQVIDEARADVVCLQELDNERARSGHVRQAERIAELLGMYHHFHPALRLADEEYGDAILSPHPMKVVKAGQLPKLERQVVDETRGALWVTLTVNGRPVQVMNTHLGLGRAERRAQAAALLGPEWLGAAEQQPAPIILCGDLNSMPGWVVHSRFAQHLVDAQSATLHSRHARTFPTRLPLVCLDYIFVSRSIRVLRTQVLRNAQSRVASDHYPLLAELELPGVGETKRVFAT